MALVLAGHCGRCPIKWRNRAVNIGIKQCRSLTSGTNVDPFERDLSEGANGCCLLGPVELRELISGIHRR